jgi:hypothetical protein
VPTFSSGQPAVRTAGYGEVAFCEVVQALAEKRAEAAASPGRRARSPDSGPPSRSGCPRPRPSSTGELATATAAQSCLCTAPRSWAARSTSTPRCWWPTGWRSSWHPTRPPEPKGGTPPRPAGRVGRSPARPRYSLSPRAPARRNMTIPPAPLSGSSEMGMKTRLPCGAAAIQCAPCVPATGMKNVCYVPGTGGQPGRRQRGKPLP